MDKFMIDTRLKRFVKSAYSYEDGVCSIGFKDLEDVFWFNNKAELQEFLNLQTRERFYDKSLRKGYFDYVNENGDTLRYNIDSVNRGRLEIKSDMIQVI